MRQKTKIYTVILAVLALTVTAAAAGAPKAGSRDEPVTMDLQVEPRTASAGQEVQVTLQLTPRSGFKLNKYPNITLKVPEVEGVVAAASGAAGSKNPPPPESLDDNYFKTVEPVILSLELDPGLKAGRYDIPGKLKFFYCVKASGYCAPMRQDVSIPVTVK